MLEGKKLLVLGGKPIGSVDIVNYANSIGAYTIVADYLPPSSSPAKQIAKESWDISTDDIDSLERKSLESGVNAIITGCHDFNIDKAIILSERLKLPLFINRQQFERTTQKDYYTRVFESHGLPSIKKSVILPGQSIDIDSIPLPAIVKPSDGSSGFGISISKDYEELKDNIATARQVAKNSTVIVEEYVSAPEITIFYLIQDGDIRLSAIADRKTTAIKEGVIPLPTLYIFPASIIGKYIELYDQKVKSSLLSMGLRNGIVFLQAFWRNDECLIYDIGFRITGTQEYNLLDVICGVNPLKLLVDYSLNGSMGPKNNLNRLDPYFDGRYAAIITLLMSPGSISNFTGIKDIESINGVVKFVLNHEIGETIPPTAEGTLVQVAARCFVIVSSEREIYEIEKKVYKVFKVEDNTGHNLLIYK